MRFLFYVKLLILILCCFLILTDARKYTYHFDQKFGHIYYRLSSFGYAHNGHLKIRLSNMTATESSRNYGIITIALISPRVEEFSFAYVDDKCNYNNLCTMWPGSVVLFHLDFKNFRFTTTCGNKLDTHKGKIYIPTFHLYHKHQPLAPCSKTSHQFGSYSQNYITKHTTTLEMRLTKKIEEGLYQVLMFGCPHPNEETNQENFTLRVDVTEKNGKSYLSLGEIGLDWYFCILALAYAHYFISMISIIIKFWHRVPTIKVYFILATLSIIKCKSLLLSSLRYYTISNKGVVPGYLTIADGSFKTLFDVFYYMTCVLMSVGIIFSKSDAYVDDYYFFLFASSLKLTITAFYTIAKTFGELEDDSFVLEYELIQYDAIMYFVVILMFSYSRYYMTLMDGTKENDYNINVIDSIAILNIIAFWSLLLIDIATLTRITITHPQYKLYKCLLQEAVHAYFLFRCKSLYYPTDEFLMHYAFLWSTPGLSLSGSSSDDTNDVDNAEFDIDEGFRNPFIDPLGLRNLPVQFQEPDLEQIRRQRRAQSQPLNRARIRAHQHEHQQ